MTHGLMRKRIANGDWRRADNLSNVVDAVSARDACNRMERASRDVGIPTFLIDPGDGQRLPIAINLKSGDGSMAMPYERMWVESVAYFDNDKTGRFVALVENPNNYAPECEGGAVLIWWAMCATDAQLTGVTSTVLVSGECDERGVVRPTLVDGKNINIKVLPHLASLNPQKALTQDVAHDLATRAVWDVLYLFMMLSCRNVEVVKRKYQGNYDRKRRKYKGGYQYHTIVVRNKDKRIVCDADPLAPEGPPARHMVRGHFKTYTSEAPLMGKLTGRYYWPPHARGSRAVGEIEHEYRVG